MKYIKAVLVIGMAQVACLGTAQAETEAECIKASKDMVKLVHKLDTQKKRDEMLKKAQKKGSDALLAYEMMVDYVDHLTRNGSRDSAIQETFIEECMTDKVQATPSPYKVHDCKRYAEDVAGWYSDMKSGVTEAAIRKKLAADGMRSQQDWSITSDKLEIASMSISFKWSKRKAKKLAKTQCEEKYSQ